MILTSKQHFNQCISYNGAGEYIASYKHMTLYSVFQPIFSLEKNIVGVEALVRIYTKEKHEIRPDSFFHSNQYSYIDLLNVELLSRAIHIHNFSISTYRNIKLFLNILPDAGQFIVQNENLCTRFADKLSELNLSHPQIVMEVVEQETNDEHLLQRATNQLSQIGFNIAVDDFGSQASTYERVELIEPDIIKFDRSLLLKYMSGDKEPLLQAIKVAKNANAKTVVEGIETAQQFEEMRKLKLNMYQGYFLGMPQRLVSCAEAACG